MATLQTDETRATQMMTSTTDLYDTIRERSDSDADFRISLLENAAESIISGDLEEGKAALRLYIKTSIGYKRLADLTGIHPKSLVRMLGPEGNPRASNLTNLLAQALRQEGVRIEVKAKSESAKPPLTATYT